MCAAKTLQLKLLASEDERRRLQDHIFTLQDRLLAKERRIEQYKAEAMMSAKGLRKCVEEREVMAAEYTSFVKHREKLERECVCYEQDIERLMESYDELVKESSSDYIVDPDRRFVADTIAAIGLCAQRLPSVPNTCLEGLLALIAQESSTSNSSHMDGETDVLVQAITSVKAILKQNPSDREKVMDPDHEDIYDFDPLDDTKTWSEDPLPLQLVGRLVLNRNIDNFFQENEQFLEVVRFKGQTNTQAEAVLSRVIHFLQCTKLME